MASALLWQVGAYARSASYARGRSKDTTAAVGGVLVRTREISCVSKRNTRTARFFDHESYGSLVRGVTTCPSAAVGRHLFMMCLCRCWKGMPPPSLLF